MGEEERINLKVSYLREIDLFQDLSPEELRHLSQRAPIKRVPKGTIFYTPEDSAEVLFILKEGRVRLYQLLPDGRTLTLAILEAGAVFGEMVLLGQELHGSFAEALTPCLLCLMSRNDVRALLLGDPRIVLRILEAMGRRLIEAERRLLDLAYRRVPERLALLLAELAARTPSRGPADHAGAQTSCIELSYTHEELAALVGAYRETVTKALNDLQKHGLIELRRGKVLVFDPEQLRRFAMVSSTLP